MTEDEEVERLLMEWLLPDERETIDQYAWTDSGKRRDLGAQDATTMQAIERLQKRLAFARAEVAALAAENSILRQGARDKERPANEEGLRDTRGMTWQDYLILARLDAENGDWGRLIGYLTMILAPAIAGGYCLSLAIDHFR